MTDVKSYINKLYKKHKTLDPYELADKMEIIIHYADLKQTRGFCYSSHRIRQVFLNDTLPQHIKKFVLAHEIGHLIMHPKHNAPFLQSTFFSMNRYEIEANKFAIEMIMTDLDIMEHWEYTIDEWAMFYGLPRGIIELRFK